LGDLLAGKSAVITGAGSGVGRAVAHRFVAEGARVVALDLSDERLAALQKELGGGIVTVSGDVRSYEANARAVAAAAGAFGGLDVFVGNAGVFDGFKSIADLTPDQIDRGFDDVFGVNVKGYMLGARAAIEQLAARRGNMVFTASTAAFSTGGGGTIYTAAKHAVVGMVRELAYELGPRGIRVNGVAPGGVVDSNLYTPPSFISTGEARLPVSMEEREKRLRGSTLLGVANKADDHAWLYVVLASEQSRALTGVVVSSDGGLLVKSPRG